MRQRAKYIHRLKKQNERKYYASIFLALRRMKAPVIATLKKDGVHFAIERNKTIDSVYLQRAIRKMWYELAPIEAEREYRYMMRGRKGLGEPSFNWLSDIATFFDRFILDQIRVNMLANTQQYVMRVLQRGLVQGNSISEMVRELQDTELDKKRARLIVRTEVNRAMNYGHQLGTKNLPFPVLKEWVSARDWRVRGDHDDTADHRHMNGQKVPNDEPFTDPRSGAKLMFPGDSSLGAGGGDVCNCRCVVVHEERL